MAKKKAKTQAVAKTQNATVEKEPYRPLDVKERDMLFAFYEKHNGNMSAMIRDDACIFKGYNQIRHYVEKYGFREQLVENRKKMAEEVMERLQDAKVLAIQNAMRMLEPQHQLVMSKNGMQVYNEEGEPLILERLPYYQELKTAWEIIKTELGEPISVSKSDITSNDEPIRSINVNVVHGAQPNRNSGVREELPEQGASDGQSGGDGKQ